MTGDRRPLLVILRALKLGDLLTAVPALRALAAAFPGHRRVLAAPAWLTPLALHTGTIDAVADTAELAPLDPALHEAAVAVNLHGRGPQSVALLEASRPRRLISFGRDGGPRWRAAEHERDRWCRLLVESGIPADPHDLHLDPPPVTPPPVAVGATVIHPGASTGSRRWPAHRWAAVAAEERQAGRPVVITGSGAERELAGAVAAAAGLPHDAVLAGRTSLLELLAVVAGAARVVCGDTGVAHVASALAIPSVVLFGPTPPAEWGPPAAGPHRVLWCGPPGDPAADEVHPGLLRITVDDVVDALATLPNAVALGAATGPGAWR